MSDKLNDKLVEILTGIQSAVKSAGDFAIEQLPDIATQYILYGRVKSAVIALFLLCVIVALYGFAYWAYKNPWNTSEYLSDAGKKRSESNYTAMIFPPILATGLLLIVIWDFDYLVWFAPKVWLIKEIATLIK